MVFTKENAAEYGRRGGKQTSERKQIMAKINRRKKCDSRCPLFDKCPLMPLAMSSEDKACKLKQLPQPVKIKFYNLFLAGEEGLIQEIRQIVWRLMLKVEKEGDTKEMERLAKLLLELHKQLYGDKKKLDVGGSLSLKIVVEEVDVDED